MPATRALIREHLKRNRSATAAEMSRSLGLTAADVRYHLKFMQANGEIEIAPAQSVKQRGRPARAFRLAQSRRPNALAHLASVLLTHLEALREDPTDLAAAFLPPPDSDLPITHRLSGLVQGLNRHHYDSRWEAHARGPRVIFANCPFAPILAHHPELCRMDQKILEQWSHLSVEQLSRFDPHSRSMRVCIFHLHDKSASE